jgi:hypothetical protein
MGRLHSNGKGISASALPYSRTARMSVPSTVIEWATDQDLAQWLKTTPEAVV